MVLNNVKFKSFMETSGQIFNNPDFYIFVVNITAKDNKEGNFSPKSFKVYLSPTRIFKIYHLYKITCEIQNRTQNSFLSYHLPCPINPDTESHFVDAHVFH